ncbi:MAG: hypothetical protein GTO40_02980 [Deltaproteobacteria bacterium]|nr:hypothetical protein [Deltaproteobacteria bacterium]
MSDSANYTMEQFIEDAKKVFASTEDPRAQAGGIAKHMEKLLASPTLPDEIKKRAAGRTGRIDLHVDPQYGHPGPGFCLMTSLPDPKGEGGSRERYPHDHGASFVVYGVYKGATQQIKFRWTCPEGGNRSEPELKEYDRFTQNTGQAAFFLPGEIHMTGTVGGERSSIIRLEAQKLDRVKRHAYKAKGANVVLM